MNHYFRTMPWPEIVGNCVLPAVGLACLLRVNAKRNKQRDALVSYGVNMSSLITAACGAGTWATSSPQSEQNRAAILRLADSMVCQNIPQRLSDMALRICLNMNSDWPHVFHQAITALGRA